MESDSLLPLGFLDTFSSVMYLPMIKSRNIHILFLEWNTVGIADRYNFLTRLATDFSITALVLVPYKQARLDLDWT